MPAARSAPTIPHREQLFRSDRRHRRDELIPAQFYQVGQTISFTLAARSVAPAVSRIPLPTECSLKPPARSLSAISTRSPAPRRSSAAPWPFPLRALQGSTLTSGGTGLSFLSAVTSDAFTLGGLSGTTNLALQNSAATAIAVTVGSTLDNTSNTYSGILSGAGGSSLIKAAPAPGPSAAPTPTLATPLSTAARCKSAMAPAGISTKRPLVH